MNLIQYYLDVNEALIKLYITHPSVWVLSYLVYAWCVMACILMVANNEMLVEAIIKAYIIKILRE